MRVRLLAGIAPVVLATLLLPGCPPAAERPVPASPAGADRVLVPPLAEIAVGEELRLARLDEEWIYRVVAVGESDVRVEFRKTVGGDAVGAPSIVRWHRNAFGVPEDAVIVRFERTEREVGGRPGRPGVRRPCWLLYVTTPSAGRFYYWVSDEVGVHGVLAIAKEHEGRPDETHAMRWVHDSVSGWR